MAGDKGGIWQAFKQALSDFNDDRAPRLAAALSYYTIFSLAPLLLIVITVAGMIWGQEAVRGQLMDQFSSVVGEEGGKQIETMIANVSRQNAHGIMLAVGIGAMIFGALGVFVQLKDALNTVWEVRIKKPGGLRTIWLMIRTYLLSFAMIFVIAFLLVASLIASAALAAAGKWMNDILPVPEPVLQAVNLVVSFGVLTLLFAAIFKILPDVRIQWKDVWVGAMVTSLLFTIGKFALGLYLGRSAAASVYGAAGSIIIILLWVYYASLIFMFGAEVTQVYAWRWGSRIKPSDVAEAIPGSDLEREKPSSGERRASGRDEPAKRGGDEAEFRRSTNRDPAHHTNGEAYRRR